MGRMSHAKKEKYRERDIATGKCEKSVQEGNQRKKKMTSYAIWLANIAKLIFHGNILKIITY